MKEKRAKIIVLSMAAVIIIVAAASVYMYINRFQFNDPNMTGNTTGNLNNGGMFCEYDGKIYFSNPYDNGYLYRMDSDCTHAVKLSSDRVAYINTDGRRLYYVRNNAGGKRSTAALFGRLFGVYRCNMDGSGTTSLYEKQAGAISLCGNYIYYQHYDTSTALTLYKVKIDNSENVMVSDKNYLPSSFYNGRIYFANVSDDHSIYTLDTENNDSMSLFLDANAYMADMEGQYLYYIDQDDDYALIRYNPANRMKERLIEGKCVHYNLYGTKLFAMVEGADVRGIYRMNVDGSQKELIATGDFNNISCTSQYTFFQYFNDDVTLYRVPTTGPINTIEQILIK